MHKRRTVVLVVMSALLTLGAGSMPGRATPAMPPAAPAPAPAPSERAAGVEGTTGKPVSVADVEAPSVVRDRAAAALADRLVDVWVTPDQASYVVGVHHLTAAETPALLRSLVRRAPVIVVDRPVSRMDLDVVADQVRRSVRLRDLPVQEIATDYESGVVLVSAGTHVSSVSTELGRATGITPRSAIDPVVMPAGVPTAALPTPQVVVTSAIDVEQESPSANPYRAGKYLAVGGARSNCTASFLVRKNGRHYGMTAGHCGRNGAVVRFAGRIRGTIQHNTLWARNPARTDAALFPLSSDASLFLFESTSRIRRVTGAYKRPDLVKNMWVCTRGAFSAAPSCGPITAVNVTTYSNIARRNVQTGFAWKKVTGPGTRSGDSGAPVYRVLANGNVWAVGVHRAGDGRGTSYFTPLQTILLETGAVLVY